MHKYIHVYIIQYNKDIHIVSNARLAAQTEYLAARAARDMVAAAGWPEPGRPYLRSEREELIRRMEGEVRGVGPALGASDQWLALAPAPFLPSLRSLSPSVSISFFLSLSHSHPLPPLCLPLLPSLPPSLPPSLSSPLPPSASLSLSLSPSPSPSRPPSSAQTDDPAFTALAPFL